MMGELILPILVGALLVVLFLYKQKGDTWLSDFERKMNNRGFTKRIIVYDFVKGFAESQSVGIWLNYPKQSMGLRLDNKAKDVIEISFEKIKKVQIIEDEYFATNSGLLGVPVGPVLIGGSSATSKGRSKGLQVRIETWDKYTGPKPYFLKLYNPPGSISKSDPMYKAIQECARSIVGECENIMRHSEQY